MKNKILRAAGEIESKAYQDAKQSIGESLYELERKLEKPRQEFHPRGLREAVLTREILKFYNLHQLADSARIRQTSFPTPIL